MIAIQSPSSLSIIAYLHQPLIGYCTHNHSIIYITRQRLTILQDNVLSDSVHLQGMNVVNFVINKRNQIAILYKDNTVEIRRIDCIADVVKKIQDIKVDKNSSYPLIKMMNQELYIVNPAVIEIISLKDLSRSKYTDLVSETQKQKIYDLLLLNLIDSLTIGVLQLYNRLVVAIIPCPITEIHIQGIAQIKCLHPNTSNMHPRTTYLAVLAQDTQKSIIKIYDLLTLKQIAQLQLFQYGAAVQIETDPQCQCLIVHYLDPETSDTLLNLVYKINTAVYYNLNRDQSKAKEPFFLYQFEINIEEYLCMLNFQYKEDNHVFSFYYFNSQKIYFFKKSIRSTFKQKQSEFQCFTDLSYWRDNEEWKDIISTYLQIENQYISQNKQKMRNYLDQERQLEQYYEISKDFDSIVAHFSELLAQKSKKKALNQKEVQKEWQSYLQKVAKQKNFMKETMNLFKLDYQIVKEPSQQKNLIGIELQTCMKDLQGRQSRVDAKIREKKMQLEQEQLKRQKQKSALQKPKLTQAEIAKEQQQYNKFVTQYLTSIQQRQAQETSHKLNKTRQMNPQLKLQLPNLTQQERKIIQHNTLDFSNNSSLSIQKEQSEANPAWNHLLEIIEQIQQEVSPLQQNLQRLIDKIDKFEHCSLQAIKKNESKIQNEMQINLEHLVKSSCRQMLSKLKDQIKTQMNTSLQKLYKMEEKSIRQNAETIQMFKQFARMQVKHRIEVYHKSRKQLQATTSDILKKKAQQKTKKPS